MSKIFVIAGNRAEANIWIKSHLDKRMNAGETTLSMSEYVFVSRPEQLRGWNEPHGVFIGTWIERVDLEEIFRTLLVCHSISDKSHRVINQLWGEWKDKMRSKIVWIWDIDNMGLQKNPTDGGFDE